MEDDNNVLSECYRVLRPGGVMILSASAFNILKGGLDIAAHGVRRYSVFEIRSKLEKSGFIVKRISYVYLTLFPLVFILRKSRNKALENKKAVETEFSEVPFLLGVVIKTIFFCEAQLLRFMNMPFGVSVMAVAVKP